MAVQISGGNVSGFGIEIGGAGNAPYLLVTPGYRRGTGYRSHNSGVSCGHINNVNVANGANQNFVAGISGYIPRVYGFYLAVSNAGIYDLKTSFGTIVRLYMPANQMLQIIIPFGAYDDVNANSAVFINNGSGAASNVNGTCFYHLNPV